MQLWLVHLQFVFTMFVVDATHCLCDFRDCAPFPMFIFYLTFFIYSTLVDIDKAM